jgi:hypothetical protein
MTPRFVDRGEKVIALIHQLAREFWFYEMPYPVAWLGYHYLEERWLQRYRDILTITVSDSTKEELACLGFKNIRVVPTAPMFAQAILNIWGGMSVSSLFETDTLVPIYEGLYQRS